jgi:hypothetical protein
MKASRTERITSSSAATGAVMVSVPRGADRHPPQQGQLPRDLKWTRRQTIACRSPASLNLNERVVR